jgi:hypothetical protein
MEKIFKLGDEYEKTKMIGRSFPQVRDSATEDIFTENGKRVEEEKFKVIPPGGYSIKITKGVKLTDVFSSFMVIHNPIISEKLASLLQEFSIPPFQLIPVNVYRLKELVTEKKYFIMHFLGNDLPHVNFKESTYYFYSGAADTVLDTSILKFDDYADYLAKRDKDHRIYLSNIRQVVMKASLQHQWFFLDQLDYAHPFITQTLKERFDRENITGFRYNEVGYIKN